MARASAARLRAAGGPHKRSMKKRIPAAAWLILLLALLLRVGYIAATPDYKLVHDALDYDHAATSIASGDGWPYSRAPGAGDRVPPARLPGPAGRRLQGRGRRARERARPRASRRASSGSSSGR